VVNDVLAVLALVGAVLLAVEVAACISLSRWSASHVVGLTVSTRPSRSPAPLPRVPQPDGVTAPPGGNARSSQVDRNAWSYALCSHAQLVRQGKSS
jgi:hypothetical protein